MAKPIVILDFSANTHKNDFEIIQRMIKAIDAVDSGKCEIIFKGQLFKSAGKNIVCSHEAFKFMYDTCKKFGYKCTASVFDIESTEYLMDNFKVPFIKIACNQQFSHLMRFIPEGFNVIRSLSPMEWKKQLKIKINYRPAWNFKYMFCVQKYPADVKDYENCQHEISDHTIGLELYKSKKPLLWEKHLKFKDSDGLDAGPFAITPKELEEIL